MRGHGERRRAPGAAPSQAAVIRDQLLAALHAALDACGFPAPPDGIELTPPKDPGHGDFTTNVALQLAKPVGMAPRDVAAKIVEELERARPGPPRAGRDRGPGLPQPPPRPQLAARGAPARWSRRVRPTATATRSTACASTSSSSRPTPPGRSTPAAAAGWRSATRSPTSSPPRAPSCTASTT